MLVCDLAALNPSERHQQELDQLDHEEREERERAERDLGKHSRGLFNCFEKKGMVSLVFAAFVRRILEITLEGLSG